MSEPTFARTRLGAGPGLLLAHGAGSSLAGTYGPILEGLAARFTVVGIDYPGSGDTPRSTTPLSVDDLADELVAAADAEGLDRFALSGYSLGGSVAIRAAARHPERVTALVLTAAFPYRDNRLALASRSRARSPRPATASCSPSSCSCRLWAPRRWSRCRPSSCRGRSA